MNQLSVAFVSGFVFAIGLGIGGMTQPAKIVNFLDVAGNWDPSLAFVIGGAIFVHATLRQLTRGRPSAILGERFTVPTRKDIDPRLVGGAAVFGLGWGLSGYCPGPALTALASGRATVLIFVGAMIGGMWLYTLTTQLRQVEPQPDQAAIADA